MLFDTRSHQPAASQPRISIGRRPATGRAPIAAAAVVIVLLIGVSYAFRLSPPPLPPIAEPLPLYSDAPANTAFTDRMLESLQDWLRLHPDDERRYALLGAGYLQKARETADPAYYSKAESVLQKAADMAPGDFEALASLGVLALSRHQFRDGLMYGQQAHRLNPYNARALGVIVDAQVELGDYTAAAQSVQRMVDLRPDMGSYARVSYVRELFGNWQGALVSMRQAVTAGSGVPENLAWTHTHVGLLLFNHGDLSGARQEYEDALRASPGYIPAEAGLARVLAAQGDVSTAISHFEHAAQVMPLSETVVALADCYALAGRAADAQRTYALVDVIDRLQRANGVDTDLEMALFQADHAAAQIDLAQTVAHARTVFAQRPTIYAADVLAWSLYQAGQFDEAQTYAQQALRLGSQDALLWFHAGMIDARLGRRAEAAHKLAHALQLNPNFSLLWSETARQALAEVSR